MSVQPAGKGPVKETTEDFKTAVEKDPKVKDIVDKVIDKPEQ